MTALPNMQALLEVMNRLRDPRSGCPWDLAQDFASIVPHTIEEAYEVADTIERGDLKELPGELGDLLFQVVFYAHLGKERDLFDFDAVAGLMVEKLIRRHPHVFRSSGEGMDKDQVSANWEQIKQQERAASGKDSDTSALANIPRGMAPITRAYKLQKQAAKVGFDWPDIAPVLDKIQEEIDEVMAEVNRDVVEPAAVEDEIGDLLFAVMNLARHAGVDADRAMRRANHKFETRFRAVESLLSDQGLQASDCTLDQLETLWQRVKQG